jgi:hypothetical protein
MGVTRAGDEGANRAHLCRVLRDRGHYRTEAVADHVRLLSLHFLLPRPACARPEYDCRG